MLKDFSAIKISIASPEDILAWSYGEVKKAETINYRTLRPEPGGLMAEEIFGPTKDYQCYCGKYKRVRYKGIVCDRCGVEVTHKRVRRHRMGHIKLAAPVCHVWFSHGVPNRLSTILDIPQKQLEMVIYYARYIVTSINEEQRKEYLKALPNYKQNEYVKLQNEHELKLKEIEEMSYKDLLEIKKTISDQAKVNMQIERHNNALKQEKAKLKLMFDQKIASLEKKFVDLKKLIELMQVGSTLSEEEYNTFENYGICFFDAGMGAEAIKKLLENLDLSLEIQKLEFALKESKSDVKKSKIIQRLKILKRMFVSNIKPSWLVLDVLPVIPPDIRPIVQLPGGRFATYDLNDLYRRVINRNNRLKRLISLGAPEIILRNEKRMLQEAVDSLFDNQHKPGTPSLNSRQMPFKSLSDMLRGKYGRFRQNLLGKRVDYSGNAVIVSGPELNFNQCGIPKVIALEIFKPFVIRELISKGIASNPAKAKVLFEQKIPEVWDILEEVSKNRPVLLNRAPTLHKQSILAFYPVLIEGNAIRIHPMVCAGFNADFDGDQMAVYLPLTDEAVQEAKERMFPSKNVLNLRDGSPIVNVEKDMALGIYLLTYMENIQEITNVYHTTNEVLVEYELGRIGLNTPVKVLVDGKLISTTPGRIIFNMILPKDMGFINKDMTKSDIEKLTLEIFSKFGNEKAIQTLDLIKELGFKYACKTGFSVSMQDFRFENRLIIEKLLQEFSQKENELYTLFAEGFATENELRWKNRDLWLEYSEKIKEEVWLKAKKECLDLVKLNNSGALSVKEWLESISAVKGFVTDASGNIVELPLQGNFEKGFNNFEYFVSAKGARKGFTDVALRTADSGYLTRRLVDVAQDVITNEIDCNTNDGIYLYRSDDRTMGFMDRIKGRFVCEDVINPITNEVIVRRSEVITKEKAQIIHSIEGIDKIKVRSPITCKKAHGICTRCYGYDNGTGQVIDIGEAVGIIAAHSIGERTTQFTLQSKSSARASKADVTQGVPRVEELLEVRTPVSKAILSPTDGTVNIVETKKGRMLRVVSKPENIVRSFNIDDDIVLNVADGQEVKKGTLLFKKDKKRIIADCDSRIQIKDDKLWIISTTSQEFEYLINDDVKLLVEDEEIVSKGQQLTVGTIDPKELMKLKGIEAAQKYIIDELQKVYGRYRFKVDDRHFEVILRQMFRYCLVTDSGDSQNYFYGDYVDYLDVLAENSYLEAQGKKTIKYERTLMGITSAALRTESFLAAASFEQQVRVLTEAALMGKVDYLRGLKENVIIGKPVPLGNVLKRSMGLLK
ncbi:MAG: DNA-directed RNA polymerase subunit beta' [Candidatus Dojkabacteria bacterium]|nr:DNA-directed RNA polymerase subunit beta' [Candidatus Dojkabacteria bacterium]